MKNGIETLEHHLNTLEKAKLIQKKDSSYSLTKEGKRRLSELGVTELEAMELTLERNPSHPNPYTTSYPSSTY